MGHMIVDSEHTYASSFDELTLMEVQGVLPAVDPEKNDYPTQPMSMAEAQAITKQVEQQSAKHEELRQEDLKMQALAKKLTELGFDSFFQNAMDVYYAVTSPLVDTLSSNDNTTMDFPALGYTRLFSETPINGLSTTTFSDFAYKAVLLTILVNKVSQIDTNVVNSAKQETLTYLKNRFLGLAQQLINHFSDLQTKPDNSSKRFFDMQLSQLSETLHHSKILSKRSRILEIFQHIVSMGTLIQLQHQIASEFTEAQTPQNPITLSVNSSTGNPATVRAYNMDSEAYTPSQLASSLLTEVNALQQQVIKGQEFPPILRFGLITRKKTLMGLSQTRYFHDCQVHLHQIRNNINNNVTSGSVVKMVQVAPPVNI